MTNRERLISFFGFTPSDDLIDGELLDRGVDGTDVYDRGSLNTLKLSAINIIDVLFTTPDTTNENGYLIKYDRDALLKLQNRLKTELGLIVPVGPTVEAKHYW